MALSAAQTADLEQKLAIVLEKEKGLKALRTSESGMYTTLRKSDALLKAMIPYFSPPHVRPVLPEGGDAEYGAIAYWAANPDGIPYSDKIPSWVKTFIKGLSDAGIIPQPTVTDADYQALLVAVKAGTAIADDGTLYGTGPYEQLNYDWLQAIVNLFMVKHHYGKAPFGTTPAKLNMSGISGADIKIAVLGDWGTGETDALDVAKAAMDLNPDYMIHLGDVYYTGTPKTSEALLFWGQNDEVDHLVDVWPAMGEGRSFTLNSNHEMYCGAQGYFPDALGSSIFSAQQGTSYFLLQNDDWQIFGLDSAYDSPDSLYMYGALTADQISFVQDNLDASKKTIFMTHHTPYDLTGEVEQVNKGMSLLKDAQSAMNGGLPDYWYFGHIHDGVVYEPKTVNGSTSLMRCTGHGAMPYGAPWGLTKPGSRPPFAPTDYISGITFFAGTPMDASKPEGQVKNGFMLLTLSGGSITEEFYDEDGTRTWPC